MSRFLIINADDFGLTHSVNKAIITVFKQGNLTSATLMVNMPGFEDAVEKAKENPKLGVGMHFCLTQGNAVYGPSTLTDSSGRFYSRNELNRKITTAKIKTADIRNELTAQLQKFREHLGEPTHIDSHQHMHMNPWIFLSLLRELKNNQLRIRLIAPPPEAGLVFHRPVKAMKQYTLMLLSLLYRRMLNRKTNDFLISIHEAKNTLTASPDYYKKALTKSPDGSIIELMVHPYLDATDIRTFYPDENGLPNIFLRKCMHEFRLLSGNPLFNDTENFQLIRYDQF